MATREEEVKVKVTGADQGARDLEKMGGTAKVAGEAVKGMGKEADKASKGVDELGDEAKQTAGQLDTLERQILKAKVALAALGAEYAKVGDEKIGVELDKQSSALAKLEGRARTISRLAKDLEPKGGGGEGSPLSLGDLMGGPAKRRSLFGRLLGGLSGAASFGSKAAMSGADALTKQFSDISPMTLAKIGVGVAAAPGALGAVGGAVLAGGAAAGVGLGVGGAIAGNPQVFKDAWGDAISKVSQRWQRASLDFEKPTLSSLHILENAVENIHLEKILQASSKYVEPLARGIAGFITPLGNGLEKLVDKAGPVVEVLEKDLPMLGKAIEEAFGDIGDGADGAADALDDVISVIGTAVIAFGKLVKAGSEFYEWGQKNLSMLGGQEVAVTSVGRALTTTEQPMHRYVVTQQDLADAALAAADAQRKEFGIMLSAGEAADNATIATQKLNETLKNNGYVIEGNGKKALENRDAIRQTIRAWEDESESAAAAGGNTKDAIDKANGVLLKHLEDLRAVLKAHGQNTDEVDAYIAKLKELDGMVVTTTFKNVYVNIGTPNERQRTGQSRLGAGDQYASGGDVRRTGLALVGEEGPELVALSQGDHVFTAAETSRMRAAGAAGSRGGYGGGGGVSLPPQSVIEQALAAVLLRMMQDGRLPVPSSAVR